MCCLRVSGTPPPLRLPPCGPQKFQIDSTPGGGGVMGVYTQPACVCLCGGLAGVQTWGTKVTRV